MYSQFLFSIFFFFFFFFFFSSEKITAGEQQNPLNDNPSTVPEINNLPPEPSPIAAPATEPIIEKSPSDVETVEEAKEPVGEEVKNAANAEVGDEFKDTQDPIKQEAATEDLNVESLQTEEGQEKAGIPKQKDEGTEEPLSDLVEKVAEQANDGEGETKPREGEEKSTKEGEAKPADGEMKTEEETKTGEEETKTREGETKPGEGEATKPSESKEAVSSGEGVEAASPKEGEDAPPEKEEAKTPGEGEVKPGEGEPEKMPSFDEWKEKMLQEEEAKKKEQGEENWTLFIFLKLLFATMFENSFTTKWHVLES